MSKTVTHTYKLYEEHEDGPVELVFYPNSHTYKVDNDRKIGVTSITGVLQKDALMFWPLSECVKFLERELTFDKAKELVGSPKLYDSRLEDWLARAKNAYKKKQKRGRDVGTEAHEWLEEFLLAHKNGTKVPDLPERTPLPHADVKQSKLTSAMKEDREAAKEDDHIIDALEKLVEWFNSREIEVLEVERIVFSRKHDYCGTLDALLRIDGKVYLVDFKTSNPSWDFPHGAYPEYFAQIGGYDVALTEEFPDIHIDGYAIWSCSKKSGEFNISYSFDREINRRWFLHCLGAKRGLQHNVRKLSSKYRENKS